MSVVRHRIRVFSTVIAACSAVALAGAAPASADCADADTVPTADNLPAIRAAIICLHNEERQDAKVALLRSDGRLEAAAQGHSDDMVARKYFGLDSPEGVTPFRRMRLTGYITSNVVWNAGETIAWASGTFATPRNVMYSWLESTSQRLTLLAPDFRHIGVGITLGAPVDREPAAAPAVTYTIDYGWRVGEKKLRACLRRAAKKRRTAHRRVMRAKCHGLGRANG
jgi:uncharacterized protein YkwD